MWPKDYLRAWLSEWLARTPEPLYLVWVRHGRSVGNAATGLIREGRYEEIPTCMHGVPGWQWRLHKDGRPQADITGDWL